MGGMILEHESKTIYKEGYKEGRMEVKRSVTQRLFQKGIKPEEIAAVVDVSVALVKEWISVPANATR